MSDRDVLIRALEASGNEQGAALARAILPEPPTPAADPPEIPPELVAAAADPANAEQLDQARQAALDAAVPGDRRADYERMTAAELAQLPETEYQQALRLLKD